MTHLPNMPSSILVELQVSSELATAQLGGTKYNLLSFGLEHPHDQEYDEQRQSVGP